MNTLLLLPYSISLFLSCFKREVHVEGQDDASDLGTGGG